MTASFHKVHHQGKKGKTKKEHKKDGKKAKRWQLCFLYCLITGDHSSINLSVFNCSYK